MIKVITRVLKTIWRNISKWSFWRPLFHPLLFWDELNRGFGGKITDKQIKRRVQREAEKKAKKAKSNRRKKSGGDNHLYTMKKKEEE